MQSRRAGRNGAERIDAEHRRLPLACGAGAATSSRPAMTQLVDIKAFLITARTGSFAAAGRELGIAPSVLTKRVDRLEQEIGVRLFSRTTRRLTLTGEGERLRPRLQVVMGEFEQALRDAQAAPTAGCAGTSGSSRRRRSEPSSARPWRGSAPPTRSVTIELLLIDRAVNPLEESFDVALGALPMSFASVIDVPLCPYDRLLVAAPGYLARSPEPQHPNDLVQHDCLVFLPVGLDLVVRDRPRRGRGRGARPLRRQRQPGAARGGARGPRPRRSAALPRPRRRSRRAAGGRPARLPLTPLWFKAMVPPNKAPQARGRGPARPPQGRVRPGSALGPLTPQPVTNSCSFSDAAKPSSAVLTSPQCRAPSPARARPPPSASWRSPSGSRRRARPARPRNSRRA